MKARTKALLAVVTATLVVGLAAGPVAASIPASPALRPPVFGSDIREAGVRSVADPSLLRARHRWFAFATNTYRNIQVSASTDLWNWTAPDGSGTEGEAMPTPPGWAYTLAEGGSFWAPSVVRVGDHYNLYFAARHRSLAVDRPGWCVGVARSNNPAGPYRAAARPVVCRLLGNEQVGGWSRSPAADEGVIDPNVYRSPTGELYLQVKPLRRAWQLQSMRLRRDGLSPTGSAHGLLYLDGGANTWEYTHLGHFTVMENPAMDYNPAARGTGRPYVLYYSGGEWQTQSYATGFATCASPLGPCTKVTTDRAWLVSSRGVLGPGGFMVAHGDGGQRWAAYHSWAPGHVGQGESRRLHVEPLTYRGASPVLQNRAPTGTFTASNVATLVTFSGQARDRDTGRPLAVTIRESGHVVARAQSTDDGTWSTTISNASLGSHRYCATIRDDHKAASAHPPCRNLVIGAP